MVAGIVPRVRRRSRVTGTRTALFEAAAIGTDPGEAREAAWVVRCEDHGEAIGVPSRRSAEVLLGDPTGWCLACRAVAALPQVHGRFRRMQAELRGVDPDFDVCLRVDPAAGEPCCRQFAYCEPGPPADPRPRIAVAPTLEASDGLRQEGVLRHEFGHAVLFFADRNRHTEREADQAALAIWGDPIRYDADDVQTLGPGTVPRPAHLG